MTSEKFARSTSNAATKREDHSSTPNPRDQDSGKGAVEEEQNQDQNHESGNTSMQGQLGHRDKNSELKDADSNLPG
jgi:hypothetical protein